MGKTDSRTATTQRCVLKGELLWRPGGDGICMGPHFVVDGQRWRVRLQCPISLTCSSPYVSLLLAAAGGNVGHTRCRLTIVNHLDHARDVVVQASKDFSQQTGRGAAAGTARTAIGDRAVIEVETLRKASSGYLQDGLLEVLVELWQQATGTAGAVGSTAGGGVEASQMRQLPEPAARPTRKLNDSTTAAAKGRIRRRARPTAAGSGALAEAVGGLVGMSVDAADDARRRRRRRARRLGPTQRAGGSLQAVAGALDGDTALCSLFAGAQIVGGTTGAAGGGGGSDDHSSKQQPR